jgi:long-chain acyl-CoA synthetase
MNAFDYFFENTSALEKDFLAGPERISFADLYMDSLALSTWLRAEVGTGKNIILLSVNNLFFLKVYLGILKSGNTCIPLDPSIEPENFGYIASLTNPEMIFITDEVRKKLTADDYRLITPGIMPEIVRSVQPAEGTSGTHEGIDMKNILAEIIFTSGSTGKPKGVMITHGNLVANTSSIIEYLELKPSDRMLVVLPQYYCYGLSLVHTHLRVGGSVVFNNSFIFLGTVINNFLDYSCTGFAGVPSHFQILLRMSDSFRKTTFPSLRYVTQAGGKLAPVFIDEFRDAFPSVKFYVMYGQTEATARLSYLPPELWERKKGSIGKGIPGVDLRVVDHAGDPVKPGETGEVIARGDNIMSGYYLDDESTALSLKDGWLWTGDLGTVDDEGYIYLTARKNEIIKVRGKRISPKEVEGVILQLPEVVDCSVEGIEDIIEGESLRATIILKDGMEGVITAETIKKHCARQLAQYKVPASYEFRRNIMMSPTGKKIKQPG